jgi:AcrR family transcriptional regulator
MTFVRARSKENKAVRLEQIKEATKVLLEEKEYHELTLMMIAKELNFTRANLYKYVSSKEEIMLLIIEDEFELILNEAENTLTVGEDVEAFSKEFASIIGSHKLYLKLFSMMFQIIEKNVTLEKLVEFKTNIKNRYEDLNQLVCGKFMSLTIEETREFIFTINNYAIGLYAVTCPSDIQKEANEISGFNFEFPNFEDEFSKFIMNILRGYLE